jgi:hypothetical protein
MEREKVFGVLAKIETTSGTDAAPTAAANAVRVVGIPVIEYGYLEPGERDDVQTGTLLISDRASPAGRFGRIPITIEIAGAGAAYSASVAPQADVFLRGAGFGRTLVTTGGSESILYTTLDEGNETFTCWFYTGRKLIKMVGCVAQPTNISAEATKRGLMAFNVMGRIAVDPTEVALPALTLSGVIPPLCHSAAANIGGWLSSAGSDPLVLRSAVIAPTTATPERPSAGATDGHAGYAITDRTVEQTMVVEVPTLPSFDPFAQSKVTGPTLPTSAWQVGTTQYNRLKVQTGRWQLRPPRQVGLDGISGFELTGRLGAGAVTSGRELNLLYD